ncbi:MAG: Atu2307/SP_0267 family LLM class monooxygenase [Candidatus Limnocylindrales bacterium]
MPPFELGLYTFGDITPELGGSITPQQRLLDVIDEARLADEVGLDVFAVGEHHRADFPISVPAVVLAAIAERTQRIRLSSSVNVLSSDDPVRVFQQFATLDLLSDGRAEIMAGRGSFTESFPLFGYDLHDYDSLFAEKLELLLEIRRSERVTWSGRHRPPIEDRGVYPRPVQDPLPVWVAIGGTPQSAIRAGTLGLPLALAIIGGQPARFAPFAELFRRAAAEAGHGPLPFSINAHGFLADDSQRASDDAWPASQLLMNRIGRERGFAPVTREAYEAGHALEGHTFTGSPQQVIDKVLYQHEIFRHDRFLLQFIVGSLEHAKVMHAIELFGTKVAPVVRAEIAKRGADAAGV